MNNCSVFLSHVSCVLRATNEQTNENILRLLFPLNIWYARYRWKTLVETEARATRGLKNVEILIRGVSCRRLEDQSRNIRVVVADVGTVGSAIYPEDHGGRLRWGLPHVEPPRDAIYIF